MGITMAGGSITINNSNAWADGSAAAPGAAFVLDADTGFYRSAANQLAAAVAGTAQWIVGDGTLAFQKSTTISIAAGTLTINAFTLGGTLSLNNQDMYGFIRLRGVDSSFSYIEAYPSKGWGINTENLAGDGSIARLNITGGVTTSVATWANVTHSGFNITSGQVLSVAGTQVVGARVVDARADDAVNSGDATTDGVIDALRDAMITHGLIAAA